MTKALRKMRFWRISKRGENRQKGEERSKD